MATITQMLDRAIKAKEGIEHATNGIVKQLAEKIIDLNRMGQLFQGLNTKGQIIGVYSKNTETKFGGAAKGKFKGEPYNFEDTGDLFKAFSLEYNNGRLDIFSTDSKVNMLKDKYETADAKLFGLTWEHEMELNYEMIKPQLVKFIKQTLHVS